MDTPLQPAITKLQLGQDATLLMCGDSTTRGYGDTFGYGYPGRIGARLGQKYDVTVEYKRYNIATGLYDLDVQTLHTGSRGNTLHIYNGGVDGSAVNSGPYNATTYYANGLVPVTPDCFFFGYGFNDYNSLNHIAATFVSQAKTFISTLMADHPGVPVIVTSQNVVSGHVGFNWFYLGSLGQAMNTFWGGLFQEYIGHGVYLDPVLQQSSSKPDIWCLDTLGAQSWHYDTAYVSVGVHPNAAGYELIAQFIFDNLVIDVVVPVGDPPVQVVTSLGQMTAGTAFSQTLSVASGTEPFTWSVSDGALPAGISLDAGTGVLSGVPTTAGEIFDFTVKVENTWGFDTQRFTGLVHIVPPPPSNPFTATGVATTKYRLSGHYYPISQKASLGGSFVHLTPRD